LLDEGNGAAVLADVNCLEVYTIDSDSPACWVVETFEQVDHGGLATARCTDESDKLAGLDLRRNPLQNRRVGTLGVSELELLAVNGRATIESLLRPRGLVIPVLGWNASSELEEVICSTLRFRDACERRVSL
jgi:hypothetical protein